jgi:DNA polymerase-3 subunit epsilon
VKKFIFDLETTGLDPKKHGIIQTAGIIRLSDGTKHKFNFKHKPFPNQILDPIALEITGTTPKMIATYAPPEKAYKALITLLSKYVDRYDSKDKFIIMGYNCTFDIGFLRQFFINNNDKYYGSWFSSYNMIDVHKLFTALRGTGLYPELEELDNMKLETVAKFYNIEIDAHDALSDIYSTEKLYDIFTQQLTRYLQA